MQIIWNCTVANKQCLVLNISESYCLNKLKNIIFFDVTPCNLLETYCRLEVSHFSL